MAEGDTADAAVFVYTGVGEGSVVPNDTVRVRVDPSVFEMPAHTFQSNWELEEVELLMVNDIGFMAFYYCKALKKIVLHDGRLEIGPLAFNYCTALKEIQLSDGVESVLQQLH